MNYLIKTFVLTTSLCLVLMGCTKEEERTVQETFLSNEKGYVAVANSTIRSARNNIFIDGVPMTGIGGFFGYGNLFPGTVFGVAINPGQRTILIRDTLSTSLQPAITLQANIEAGKKYTIFTYDTLTRAKAKIVETPLAVIDSSRLRFANLAYSSNPLPNVDVFSHLQQRNIFTNVATEQITDYIPVSSFRTDTLFIRPSGTNINLIGLTFNITAPRRNYTAIFRGRYQSIATADTFRRAAAIIADY